MRDWPTGRAPVSPPEGSRWIRLVGDLTGWPAMARIIATVGDRLPVRVWAEGPERLDDYFLSPSDGLHWLTTGPDGSGLAAPVESPDWPDGPGYFWMVGESEQMRAIRTHLMHRTPLTSEQHAVMGYWRTRRGGRRSRTVDPGPPRRQGPRAERCRDLGRVRRRPGTRGGVAGRVRGPPGRSGGRVVVGSGPGVRRVTGGTAGHRGRCSRSGIHRSISGSRPAGRPAPDRAATRPPSGPRPGTRPQPRRRRGRANGGPPAGPGRGRPPRPVR